MPRCRLLVADLVPIPALVLVLVPGPVPVPVPAEVLLVWVPLPALVGCPWSYRRPAPASSSPPSASKSPGSGNRMSIYDYSSGRYYKSNYDRIL